MDNTSLIPQSDYNPPTFSAGGANRQACRRMQGPGVGRLIARLPHALHLALRAGAGTGLRASHPPHGRSTPPDPCAFASLVPCSLLQSHGSEIGVCPRGRRVTRGEGTEAAEAGSERALRGPQRRRGERPPPEQTTRPQPEPPSHLSSLPPAPRPHSRPPRPHSTPFPSQIPILSVCARSK
jgi:hypothetical protein